MGDAMSRGVRENIRKPQMIAGRRSKSDDCPQTDERRAMLNALNQHGWNTVRAARSIGVAHREFLRLLRYHGLRDAL